jgi:anti-anti-sigma factor
MANFHYIDYTTHGSSIVATILEEKLRDQQLVEKIKDELIQIFSEATCKFAIIDMSRVQFIGSIGFLAFLAVRRITGIERVVLCNLDDNIRQLFSVCRLIADTENSKAPFETSEDIESALRLCGSIA